MTNLGELSSQRAKMPRKWHTGSKYDHIYPEALAWMKKHKATAETVDAKFGMKIGTMRRLMERE